MRESELTQSINKRDRKFISRICANFPPKEIVEPLIDKEKSHYKAAKGVVKLPHRSHGNDVRHANLSKARALFVLETHRKR